jgi:hypothetical protein
MGVPLQVTHIIIHKSMNHPIIRRSTRNSRLIFIPLHLAKGKLLMKLDIEQFIGKGYLHRFRIGPSVNRPYYEVVVYHHYDVYSMYNLV